MISGNNPTREVASTLARAGVKAGGPARPGLDDRLCFTIVWCLVSVRCLRHEQRQILQILAGSFSAASKRKFAIKYAFDSIFQALQDLHPFAPLQSQNFRKKSV